MDDRDRSDTDNRRLTNSKQVVADRVLVDTVDGKSFDKFGHEAQIPNRPKELDVECLLDSCMLVGFCSMVGLLFRRTCSPWQ